MFLVTFESNTGGRCKMNIILKKNIVVHALKAHVEVYTIHALEAHVERYIPYMRLKRM